MKLLFELSGENATLPFAELECVATVLDKRLQVAVADCPDPSATRRLAMTHVVLEYLGECKPGASSFAKLLKELFGKLEIFIRRYFPIWQKIFLTKRLFDFCRYVVDFVALAAILKEWVKQI